MAGLRNIEGRRCGRVIGEDEGVQACQTYRTFTAQNKEHIPANSQKP